MKMEKVKSSSIEAIGWEDDALRIEFKGGAMYEYKPFLSEDWEKFRVAESTGKYFYANIRHNKNISCKKIRGKENV